MILVVALGSLPLFAGHVAIPGEYGVVIVANRDPCADQVPNRVARLNQHIVNASIVVGEEVRIERLLFVRALVCMCVVCLAQGWPLSQEWTISACVTDI